MYFSKKRRKKMSSADNHSLLKALRHIIETAPMDLRKHFKLQVTGKVTVVDEDLFTVDVEVEDTPEEGQEPGNPWILPAVPVNSLAAGDGYGIYVVPEIGAEVTVGFKDGDLTAPRIDGAEFLKNRTPIGGRVGSITMVDYAGQRFTMRPDTGQVVFQSYNMDDECAGARSERTKGDKDENIDGDKYETVGGSVSRKIEMNLTETILGELHRSAGDYEEHSDYEEEIGGKKKYYQHGRIVNGAERIKVAGRQDIRIGGDRNKQVLGDDLETVAKNKQVAVIGRLRMIAAGLDLSGSLPIPISAEIGGPGICCFGGPYVLGAAVPMIDGAKMVIAFQTFQAVMSAFLIDGIGKDGEGKTVMPSASFVAAFTALAQSMALTVHPRIFLSSPV
jgi:hypothetical protein